MSIGVFGRRVFLHIRDIGWGLLFEVGGGWFLRYGHGWWHRGSIFSGLTHSRVIVISVSIPSRGPLLLLLMLLLLLLLRE